MKKSSDRPLSSKGSIRSKVVRDKFGNALDRGSLVVYPQYGGDVAKMRVAVIEDFIEGKQTKDSMTSTVVVIIGKTVNPNGQSKEVRIMYPNQCVEVSMSKVSNNDPTWRDAVERVVYSAE